MRSRLALVSRDRRSTVRLPSRRCVYSDRGQKFYGHFDSCCHGHSIRLRRSVPYRHETSGVPERANRSHAEIARAIVVHADRPLSYWGFAMATAVYLSNRLPTVANPGYATPYFQVMGELPHLSRIRVWY